MSRMVASHRLAKKLTNVMNMSPHDIELTGAVVFIKFQNFKYIQIFISTCPRFEHRTFAITAWASDHR
jgi:hypothetical protein